MKAVYFAWVRERIGKTEETLTPPPEVTTVADLITWLKTRGETYAAAFANEATIRAALDRSHVKHDAAIAGAREVAFFPPDDRRLMREVRVQAEPFDAGAEQAKLIQGRTDIGAVVAFTGLCRDEAGTLAALEIEHYPGMAETEMLRVVEAAEARWPLAGVVVVHRYGRIAPGEPIVLAIAASRHRDAAFQAASFLMDYLKTRAPFWKREHLADGETGGWVGAKETDDAAADRWAQGEGV